jgi:cell division transport system permease protein
MRLLLSIWRAFKMSLQNIVRNFWLSFVTVTVFVLTLITVNIIIFANFVAQSIISQIEERVEVTVYFSTETSLAIASSAQEFLSNLRQVRQIRLISAEEALDAFRQRYENDETIMQSLIEIDNNPFGHSLVIRAHSSADFPFILEALETPQFSQFVRDKDYIDNQQVINRISQLSDRVQLFGFVLAMIFSLIAGLIVFNTIRVAIYVHREEISIMKLVGASNWFVRAPFFLEIIFYAAVSSLISIGFVYSVFVINSTWTMWLPEVNFMSYISQNLPIIFIGQFAGLLTLGWIATWFAMHRYLKA